MKIDLQSVIEDAEKLLAGLRELDATDIDEDARGRAPRHQRSDVSLRLQLLAHQADKIRVGVADTYFSYREREKDSGRGRGEEPAQPGDPQQQRQATLPVRDGKS
jgi:hypothetical protein